MYLKTSLLYLEFCVFYQSTWVTPTHWQKPQQWWKISLTQSDSLAAQYWKHRHRFWVFLCYNYTYSFQNIPALDINQKFFHTKFQTCDKKKKLFCSNLPRYVESLAKKREKIWKQFFINSFGHYHYIQGMFRKKN